MNIFKEPHKEKDIIGIMTGTSLDSIDICLASFKTVNSGKKMNIKYFDSFPLHIDLKNDILNITNSPAKINNISQLNYALAKIFADSVRKFLTKYKLTPEKIDAIGVHGQTLWHQPEKEIYCNVSTSSTFQALDLSAFAKLTGIPVIGNFRAGDMALGGQGAPLVPVFDLEFLRSDKNIIALNIGGISNITYLPKEDPKENIIAFDTGPGNMLIDLFSNLFFRKEYDDKGKIASSGSLIQELYTELMDIEYIKRNPPKSTGRELFNFDLVEHLLVPEYEKEDVLCTLTHFTASSIAVNTKMLDIDSGTVIASGGGIYNDYLMLLLNQKLTGLKSISSDEIGISSKAKEAACFAYLAYKYILGETGNIPSVTGASHETILGVLALQ